ncbi:aminopeptidase N [Parahalioglobus pacificus]|uniref:Aminopeptidase N n=1 Tax=Parahalioglobus pacificus TaxID=930806 RepID=A0A918XGV2_9GAMM|nr:aminopeptidase N [Halioglobus pacificus]GHD31101.1 aminopeptidase N [Halioglobus pacificus]
MREAQPATIYLKDYEPPAYRIEQTQLHFALHEDYALVTATLSIARTAGAPETQALVLHGQALKLESIQLDGNTLGEGTYVIDEASLTLEAVPGEFELRTVVRIEPQNNTSLEGLYKSRTMFCTQCEAEGFRKITYFLDRPDVMSIYTVTVEADAARYPVLLSNGNCVATEALASGRHSATWHDPFPKPAYLFALVAGDLSVVEDSFTTCSGREVDLKIFVEPKDLDKCDHAMDSLKRSMRWDEETFGREYDLDIFNIVAVDDFNMGAMENKSLNIFNTSCVLASPDTTTDAGYQRVESIVAHEYFHNWSGNRVTCRDWFQLSLKEGFTVFRDAEFSSDMGSRTVKRVEDVTVLRTSQFAEDAGPMAHPVRPDSFIEISNFYTVTVYEKGAEVVRMIHTLLGAESFRRGSDLYFQRHDGQAVTCEDFVLAMEDASGVDLGLFRRWYSQAGTPEVSASGVYDEEAQTYTLTVAQRTPPTPGQTDKQPVVIPLAMGLLGDAGNLPLRLEGELPDTETSDNTHRVLTVDSAEQRFVFTGVNEAPVPSLLRGFSAPVRLDYPYTRKDLQALISHDADGFVRWDASQQLAVQVIMDVQAQLDAGSEPDVDPLLIDSVAAVIADTSLDPAMVAMMVTLPGENYLAELASHTGQADVDGIHAARDSVREALASALSEQWQSLFGRLHSVEPYQASGPEIARRSLCNAALGYLSADSVDGVELALAQYHGANNMTDRLAGLQAVAYFGNDVQRDAALADCFDKWHHEALVVNQWLQLQAMLPLEDALSRVQALMAHDAFDLRNPNKVRAVIGAFASGNPVNFHRRDGAGYRFLREQVAVLDGMNPQIASRLLGPLTKWRNYQGRGDMMRAELEELAAVSGLSPDVFEVVSRSLA